MSFSAIFHRRLRYMLTPQFDLYKRIAREYEPEPTWKMGPILDYGCGIGFGTAMLVNTGCDNPEVFGLDHDPEAHSFAEDALGNLAEFVLADAVGEGQALEGWLWFERYQRDCGLVTLIEVVEHVEPEKQGALVGKLSGVMRPSGVLILSTPNKRSQWRKHAGHVGMHDPASLRDLLSPHFESVEFEDYLGERLTDETTVSPLVAVCRRPRRS